jgi:hypothetical protein
VLAGQFGERTADMVAAVINPVCVPGRDDHEQCREHLAVSLRASPWARVIKTSDFTDSAVGLIHATWPKLSTLARNYRPLVTVLYELILGPHTPHDSGVKRMNTGQLDNAGERFAAICDDRAKVGGPGPEPDQDRYPSRRLAHAARDRLTLCPTAMGRKRDERLEQITDGESPRYGASHWKPSPAPM